MSGQGFAIVCGPGPWRVALDVPCPWCKEKRRCLTAEVFGGWCGNDYKCGTCGTYWSSEGDTLKTTEADRADNIARVAATPDPKCWDCHDSGWTSENPIDEGHPCACAAGVALAASEPESVTEEKR